jgi:TonB family protein
MQTKIVQRRQVEGWGLSLLLHGILLIAIVSAFHHFPAPIHPKPFQWNVMFVESPRQTTAIKPVGDSSPAKDFHRTTEPEVHKSVSPSTVASRPPQQAKRSRYHVAEESSDTKHPLATPSPTLMRQPQSEDSSQTFSTQETTAVTQEALPDRQPNTNMTAPLINSEPSAQPMVSSIEQELQSASASSTADMAMAPAQPLDTAPVSSPPTFPVVSGRPSTTQADYSWLQRAVSRRLEELKQSSRPFIDDSSRLKVLVKAVVSNTGELMEAEVVKSSGLNRIDQEAMTLVQRAFPMPLDRALDRQEIVIRIPITYSRD